MYRYIADTRWWSLAHKTGLAPVIKSVFWGIKLRFNGNTMTRTVGGVSCEFTIHDSHDFKRVDSLGGEKKILELMIEEVDNSDIVVDIGANIGLFSCFLGSSNSSGHLVAIEAEDNNVGRLTENINRNVDNWTIIDCALGNSDTKVPFQISNDAGTHRIAENGNFTVQQRRYDSLIDEGKVPVPDVVKIDIEGAELSALKGFGNYLSEVRTIYCEVHENCRRGLPEDVEQVLIDAGFEVQKLDLDRSQIFLKATNNNV